MSQDDGRFGCEYREFKSETLPCPKCGHEFRASECPIEETDPLGWNEYRYACPCGHVVRFFEVFQFSHYEVYDD